MSGKTIHEKLTDACCHLLRALDVEGAVAIDEAIEEMANEIEKNMSPSEPVLVQLFAAARRSAV